MPDGLCAAGDVRGQSGLANGQAELPVFDIHYFAARVQARALELMPGQPLMSHDNLDSMKTPNVANAGMSGLESLGIQAAAIVSVMPGVLGKRSGVARLDPLRREQLKG